ncbi:MAG: PKD domain-containing protein, partial [Alphaproteobacteria bacterium]
MFKWALRATVVLGLFGLALGAFGTWRAWQPGADGMSQETRAQRPALELVAPAFAQGNQPPTAHAGFDRTVSAGQTVVLDGSGSTEPEGAKVDFLWAFVSVPAGSTAALDDPTAVRPSFVADLAGDYVIELVVSEGPRDSAPDTVAISTTNSAPVADAGRDRAIALGQTVRLDGSASSDFDGDPLSYSWTLVSRPAGSGAVLDDPDAVRPSFVADVAGDYLAELSVSDGIGNSAPGAVTLSTDNVAPVADAGLDQRAVVGQRV